MHQAVSRTAALVALYRAMESSRSASTRLFDDSLAPAFLGWRFRCALRLSRLPVVGAAVPWSLIDGHWSGPRGTVAVRTRYIDDVLRRALRSGVNQVVILGAGFDSRAYRIPGIEQARVFEVDHPATQARKKDVVTRRFGTLPPHVTLAPIDFLVSTLDMVMLDSGYRKEALTFFICEGVTHYLSAPAVDALFRYVARAAAGSQMVFTYIHRGILDGSVTFSGADTTLTTVRRAGEPYTFGFDPVELPAYLTARKLSLVEDVGARTYRERYLIPRGRGQEPLAEFQRAALVEVAGHPPCSGHPTRGPRPRDIISQTRTRNAAGADATAASQDFAGRLVVLGPLRQARERGRLILRKLIQSPLEVREAFLERAVIRHGHPPAREGRPHHVERRELRHPDAR